ncbi:MAG: hypothetical protein V3T31_07550 [candidate division Zixibacteria bacterium]
MRLFVATLIIITLSTGQTFAAGIALSQSLDQSAIKFDEQAVLRIELSWDGPQSAYRFERPLQPVLDKLKVGRFSTSINSQQSAPGATSATGATGTTGGTGEVTTKLFLYNLIPTDYGQGRVEPITISYLSWPDSIPGELVTEPMILAVSKPEAKPEPKEGLPVWFYIGVGISLLGGAAVTIHKLKKRKEPAQTEQTDVELFLDDLKKIREDAGSELKKFQTGLYRALMAFLKSRYDIIPVGKTLEELVTELEATDLSVDQRHTIATWLDRAQREKYSPAKVAPGETIRLANEVEQFFEKM